MTIFWVKCSNEDDLLKHSQSKVSVINRTGVDNENERMDATR